MSVQQESYAAIKPARLSEFHGPADPPLMTLTLGDFLDHQCELYGERECAVIPWTNTRWTYNDIKQRSLVLAQYLYTIGVRPGDRVAILAGNCAEYIAECFFHFPFSSFILDCLTMFFNSNFGHFRVVKIKRGT